MINFRWDTKELTDFATNLVNLSAFERDMMRATKNLAKALLKWMKNFTPVEEYELINGWNGNNFAVRKVANGFEVLIVNTTPYATNVNDGHKAYNQFGGPYPIKRRRKVIVPYQWQLGNSEFFVYGRFFVERGIVRLSDTDEIERIILNELQKWWGGL